MIAVHIAIGIAIGTFLAQIAEPGPQASLLKGIITVGAMACWLYFVGQREKNQNRDD